MEKIIIEKMSRLLGSENIIEKLSLLSAKDFQSLLLYVFERRARDWTVTELFKQYSNSRLTGAAAISQKELINFDKVALDLLDKDFKTIEFSPITAFGVNSILASTNQKNVMSTVKNFEVIADPVTTLALESARLRDRANKTQIINLATSQRCVRLQNFDNIPGFLPHFRVLALSSAGYHETVHELEIGFICKHLTYYLNLIKLLKPELNLNIKKISILLSDMGLTEYLIYKYKVDRIGLGRLTQDKNFNLIDFLKIDSPRYIFTLKDLEPTIIKNSDTDIYILRLKKAYQTIKESLVMHRRSTEFGVDLGRIAGMGYYDNFCIRVNAENDQGQTFPIIDGGATTWLKKLLSCKKERFFLSGIGSELLCNNFKIAVQK